MPVVHEHCFSAVPSGDDAECLFCGLTRGVVSRMKADIAALPTPNVGTVERPVDLIVRVGNTTTTYPRAYQWLDIATAPKDGTVIDVWVKRHWSQFTDQDGSRTHGGEWVDARRETDSFWSNDAEDFYSERRSGWSTSGPVKPWLLPEGQVTHWMPRPEDPQPQGKIPMKTIDTLRKLAEVAQEEKNLNQWHGHTFFKAETELADAIDPATIQAILDSHERFRAALLRIVPGPYSSDDTDAVLANARAALAAAYPASEAT